MEWFYQIPGVDELDTAESFFEFFSVPYDPLVLRHCCLPVLREFHQRAAGKTYRCAICLKRRPAPRGYWRAGC